MKKENENIKHSDSTELFNVENVPQMKDEGMYMVCRQNTFHILSKKNGSKNMKMYVENMYTIRVGDGNTSCVVKAKETSILK